MSDLTNSFGWDIKENTISKNIVDVNGNPISSVEVPNYKAISRNDNGSVLSVKKNSYTPVTTTELEERAAEISGITGFDVAGYQEFKGGKVILGYLKNNKDNFEIAGSKMQSYMVIGSSFDGQKSFFVGTSDVYIRCTNEFGSLLKMINVRNTKYGKSRRDEAIKHIELYYAGQEAIYNTYNNFQNVKIDSRIIEDCTQRLLDIEVLQDCTDAKYTKYMDLKACIDSETRDLGNNLWGLFNGFTYYNTHEIKTENTTFGSVLGSKATFNKKAYNMCLEFV